MRSEGDRSSRWPEEQKSDWPKNLFKEKSWHPFDRLFEANDEDKDKDKQNKAKVAWVEFPLPKYANQYCPMQAEEEFKKWSRVDWFVEKMTEDKFKEMLCSVVREGVDIIESKYSFEDKILCSVAKIGDIKAVDRDEINGLIDIYKLILNYLQNDDKKPLSLAVFGPPGTGKSSAVEKILKAARSSTASARGGEALTCNLSQLTDPKNLTGAFHQAQERVSECPVNQYGKKERARKQFACSSPRNNFAFNFKGKGKRNS